MKLLITAHRSLSWEEKKKKLKNIFPAITDHDFYCNAGKEPVMIEKLAYKLGKTTDEFRYIIHSV
jgi:hypothetical protein